MTSIGRTINKLFPNEFPNNGENGVETFVYPNGLISNFELAVMRPI